MSKVGLPSAVLNKIISVYLYSRPPGDIQPVVCTVKASSVGSQCTFNKQLSTIANVRVPDAMYTGAEGPREGRYQSGPAT